MLDHQPNQGQTITEKFESHSSTNYAIIILTPDDLGCLASEKGRRPKLKPRARQNVILEFGFFWGALGRENICVLYEGTLDMPSDINGLTYIDCSSADWRLKLGVELKRAGFNIDLNDLA